MLNVMNYEIIPMPLKSKSWSYYEIWFRPGHLLGWDIEDLRETSIALNGITMSFLLEGLNDKV